MVAAACSVRERTSRGSSQTLEVTSPCPRQPCSHMASSPFHGPHTGLLPVESRRELWRQGRPHTARAGAVGAGGGAGNVHRQTPGTPAGSGGRGPWLGTGVHVQVSPRAMGRCTEKPQARRSTSERRFQGNMARLHLGYFFLSTSNSV